MKQEKLLKTYRIFIVFMIFFDSLVDGVLRTCAVLCHKLGFNYELAMLEKISSLGNNLTRYELARMPD